MAKIKEAKEALEREPRQKAEQQRCEQEEKERRENPGGRPPKSPAGEPEAKAQRNLTDPDSPIMKDSATKSLRKEIVKPVFGQIKGVRCFRQFLLRGMEKVSAEWDLICLGHNLLKLFRNGWAPAIA